MVGQSEEVEKEKSSSISWWYVVQPSVPWRLWLLSHVSHVHVTVTVVTWLFWSSVIPPHPPTPLTWSVCVFTLLNHNGKTFEWKKKNQVWMKLWQQNRAGPQPVTVDLWKWGRRTEQDTCCCDCVCVCVWDQPAWITDAQIISYIYHGTETLFKYLQQVLFMTGRRLPHSVFHCFRLGPNLWSLENSECYSWWSPSNEPKKNNLEKTGSNE